MPTQLQSNHIDGNQNAYLLADIQQQQQEFNIMNSNQFEIPPPPPQFQQQNETDYFYEMDGNQEIGPMEGFLPYDPSQIWWQLIVILKLSF